MNRNLMPKIVFIIVLVVLAGWTLYPPSGTLKQGIDLVGGTSLIYEINTYGMNEAEKSGLSQRMITVLRRRIDPANLQNLIWRTQGNTRFEIQMPLASGETAAARENYVEAEDALLAKNISRSKVLQGLKKPQQDREVLFKNFAQDDPNKLSILKTLSDAYDQRIALQGERDSLYSKLQTDKKNLTDAGVKFSDELENQLSSLKDMSEPNLLTSLKKYADSNNNIASLAAYVRTFGQWSSKVDKLTEITPAYTEAFNAIDKLNLTRAQLGLVLDMSPKAKDRNGQIAKLKADFSDRAALIDKVIKAYDEYRPFQGRLDDPSSLKRMLKGSGILEFRILPTQGNTQLDSDAINTYVDKLKTKGPEYASDNDYKWFEVENTDTWDARDGQRRPAVNAQFGDKTYVLASNRQDETVLHNTSTGEWKLEKAYPSTGEMGQRTIGFALDGRGGTIFGQVTGKNVGRPLCILLDNIAVSAPNILEKIPYGRGEIKGKYTKIEIDDMINKLNAGSLPARLIEQPISENTIGPSIGADNRDQGIKSGIVGVIAVIVAMAIYYLKAGSIADVALLLNVLFTLAIMAGIRATFTLSGIAGMILSIGMSVDANVLIYERIREEQLKGSSLRVAIANGYHRAFWTIFDSNLTTIIPAIILYWRGTEEIKGFALVLILGIASSMFTALFVTRVIFDFLLNKQIIKEHLMMLRLVRNPNINWMGYRYVFFGISATLIITGLLIFYTRDPVKNNKYDIEFLGGTSVQVNLKQDVELTRGDVEQRIRQFLPTANVYSIGQTGKQYEITTTQTNKTTITITPPAQGNWTTEKLTAAINKAQNEFAERLSNLTVEADASQAGRYIVSTSQLNLTLLQKVLLGAEPNAAVSQPVIDEVVNNAVLKAFANELEIQQNLQPKTLPAEKITDTLLDTHPELADFFGGIRILCNLGSSATIKQIDERLKDLQFRPDTQNLERYDYKIIPADANVSADTPLKSFVYASVLPDTGIREFDEKEWENFIENEQKKVEAACSLSSSLPRVRQFDPSVGSEQKTIALIAIVLSLLAMAAYIWVRFGTLTYGLSAIITLAHDTCITLGAVAVCAYLAKTPIGAWLLIGDFKIDMTIIAAFLTLIGYSLNDSIVIFDRIRENISKTHQLTHKVITDSINQTISRTVLTGGTTLIVVFIMYLFGGTGLRGFNFTMLFGIIIGTYSSIAISAPLLLIRAKARQEPVKA
jgi:SecD/SecF fusion protein